MSTPTQPVRVITIEYEEVVVPEGESLKVHACSPADVQILDVTRMANDLRFQYVVKWADAQESRTHRSEHRSHTGDGDS